jgi:aryl-alcohol dehydrogenase (NADP+)
MDYVNLGATGLKVSRICLGAMTYGSPKWRSWVLDEAGSRPFIRRALELGINFFDTADVYSLGESEAVLGRALQEFGPSRDKVVMADSLYAGHGEDDMDVERPRKWCVCAPKEKMHGQPEPRYARTCSSV